MSYSSPADRNELRGGVQQIVRPRPGWVTDRRARPDARRVAPDGRIGQAEAEEEIVFHDVPRIRLLLPYGGGERGPHEPVEKERSTALRGVGRGDDLARHPIGPVVGSHPLEHRFIPGVLDSIEISLRHLDQGAAVNAACGVSR